MTNVASLVSGIGHKLQRLINRQEELIEKVEKNFADPAGLFADPLYCIPCFSFFYHKIFD